MKMQDWCLECGGNIKICGCAHAAKGSFSPELTGSVAVIPEGYEPIKCCREVRKYLCTLPKGHSGPHIAEADKILDTWDN